MSSQTSLADHPIDADYDAIRAAVMETARGRWFLGEHARRNRHAETDRLAVLLEEIRAVVQPTKAPATAGANIGAAFIPVLRLSQGSLAARPTLSSEPAPRPEAALSASAEATLLRAVHAAMVGDEHDAFTFPPLGKAG